MYHPIWAFLETLSIQNRGSESLADTLKTLRDHTNICGMYPDQVSERSDCIFTTWRRYVKIDAKIIHWNRSGTPGTKCGTTTHCEKMQDSFEIHDLEDHMADTLRLSMVMQKPTLGLQ